MRAIVVQEHGGPEVLRVTETESPTPGAGEALVDVAASGINFIDVYHRAGIYPTTPPFVLGTEGAGTVAAVGSGVTEVRPGDRVAWANIPGSHAARAVVPAERLVPVPDSVELETAAAALLQGMTAHYLVTDTYAVKAGDTALVHAAAGGMGLLLTQLVTRFGGRVIGTVSTPEKEKLAREAGAAEVIRYTEVSDVAAEVRRLTDGEGVPVVYDGVGRDTFDASLASLRLRGTLVLFGAASGPVPPVDPQRLNAQGSVYLTRPTSRDFTVTAEEVRWRTGELFDAVLTGKLNVRVGAKYPLAEARKAHEDLQGRKTTGKLLLIP